MVTAGLAMMVLAIAAALLVELGGGLGRDVTVEQPDENDPATRTRDGVDLE